MYYIKQSEADFLLSSYRYELPPERRAVEHSAPPPRNAQDEFP